MGCVVAELGPNKSAKSSVGLPELVAPPPGGSSKSMSAVSFVLDVLGALNQSTTAILRTHNAPCELSRYWVCCNCIIPFLERFVTIEDGIDLVVHLEENICARTLVASIGTLRLPAPSISGSPDSASDIHF